MGQIEVSLLPLYGGEWDAGTMDGGCREEGKMEGKRGMDEGGGRGRVREGGREERTGYALGWLNAGCITPGNIAVSWIHSCCPDRNVLG